MRGRLALVILAVLAAGVIVVAPFVGSQMISPGDVLSRPAPGGKALVAWRIFWDLRVPRVLLAFLAGAGLAASGMAFQGMFRNPLATPFTLGVASGASLGAAVFVLIAPPLVLLQLTGMSVFAFGGALLAISLVYGITTLRRAFSTATLLLAGVAISFFFTSVILFIQYLSNPNDVARILRFTMGSLEYADYPIVLYVLAFVAAGSTLVLMLTHELNLMTTGDDIATSRGVNVRRTKKTLFFATSLMVGGIVALCGPIGFVGMMAPHICRMLVGWNHRTLAPATLLFGGTFLAACDTLAQRLPAFFTGGLSLNLPVGIVTALLGGPFFLWLLLRGTSEKGLL